MAGGLSQALMTRQFMFTLFVDNMLSTLVMFMQLPIIVIAYHSVVIVLLSFPTPQFASPLVVFFPPAVLSSQIFQVLPLFTFTLITTTTTTFTP